MLTPDAIRMIAGGAVALVLGSLPDAAQAQVTRGFDTTAVAVANGEERQRQPNLYGFEVQYKPMRMAFANVTDPRTGEVQRQQVWYLCYRTFNRLLTARTDETNLTPVNELDPLPGPSQFIPEFSLITFDQAGSDIPEHEYLDKVIPEAVATINEIERRRASDPLYLDSVRIVQPLPEAISPTDQEVQWTYGVAVWPNVDPETDFFKVVMRGFSNGYEVRTGPDGESVTWRKVLVQEFARRGDRYDPSQIEFELVGPPEWVYLPDAATDSQ
ncbi:MAG: hypothetical protein KF861_07835 [Planctomycetaceae bacterium]|nr:hypothetical protein [Planctomycetaceae bacterium]